MIKGDEYLLIEEKCKECLCNKCDYDYGLDVSEFSCLCKYRADKGCYKCRILDCNIIVNKETCILNI